MNSQERRTRWQQSVAHKLEYGLRCENDPVFLAWIEEWIAGDICIKEVQERYAALLLSRDKTGRGSNDAALPEDIRDQISQIRDVQIERVVEVTDKTQDNDTAWDTDP